MNKAFDKLVNNFTEIWLGLLLFVAIPLAVSLYFDYRAFFATSFFLQSVVLILFVYKGNK